MFFKKTQKFLPKRQKCCYTKSCNLRNKSYHCRSSLLYGLPEIYLDDTKPFSSYPSMKAISLHCDNWLILFTETVAVSQNLLRRKKPRQGVKIFQPFTNYKYVTDKMENRCTSTRLCLPEKILLNIVASKASRHRSLLFR